MNERAIKRFRRQIRGYDPIWLLDDHLPEDRQLWADTQDLLCRRMAAWPSLNHKQRGALTREMPKTRARLRRENRRRRPKLVRFDAANITVTFNGVVVTGFHDGTFIQAVDPAPPRVRSFDKTGSVTITLVSEGRDDLDFKRLWPSPYPDLKPPQPSLPAGCREWVLDCGVLCPPKDEP